MARRHRGVVARRAEVGGVAHAHDAHAGRSRLLDGEIHPEYRRDVPEPVVAVHERGDRRFAHDARRRRRVELIEAERFLVEHEHRDAVRVDAGEIGVGHDVGGGAHDVGRHPPGGQHFADLAENRLGGDAHGTKLPPGGRV